MAMNANQLGRRPATLEAARAQAQQARRLELNRLRVRRWRAAQLAASVSVPITIAEYCWQCEGRLSAARLVILQARRAKLSSCSPRCNNTLRQQLKRVRAPVALPPVRNPDGSRLRWSPHDDPGCRAAVRMIAAQRASAGTSDLESLLSFLTSADRPSLCSTCGLFRLLPIGARLRSRPREPEGYRYRS